MTLECLRFRVAVLLLRQVASVPVLVLVEALVVELNNNKLPVNTNGKQSVVYCLTR